MRDLSYVSLCPGKDTNLALQNTVLTNIGSNRNEKAETNYKQNKDRQNEKQKNTGNMWDPNNNIQGTEEKKRVEYAHTMNVGRQLSKEGT